MSRPSPSGTAPRTTECRAPIDECPLCGSRRFVADGTLDDVVFRCLDCATQWRVELGFVWRVA